MKNNIKPVLAILLLTFPVVTDAQKSVGYVFGINLATLDIKGANLTTPPRTTVNIQFGGAMEFELCKRIAFQPALLLSAKGSDFAIDSLDVSLSPIYLETPLNLVFSIGGEKFRVQFYAGPYFSVGIGGYKIIGAGELQELRYNNGSTGDLKPFDYGVNLGAGINIRGFRITTRYEAGLANIAHSSITGPDMENTVVAISISSLFPFRE